MRALEIAELDDLMVNESGVTIRDDEMTFARSDRNVRRESRGPRTGRAHRTSGGNPRTVREPHAAFGQQVSHGHANVQFRAVAPGFFKQVTRGAWRVHD